MGLALNTGGCVGIVPDDIGVADDATGGDEAGDDVGEDTSDDEVGTGEETEGDTTEGTTEDGTTDETTGTSDETTEGSSDGGGIDCSELFDATELMVGDNPVEILDGPNLIEACDASGPEGAYVFTAPEAGAYSFTLNADFEGAAVNYGGPVCEPFEALACAASGETIQPDLLADETLWVIIDSQGATGTGTMTIEGPL
ncbi:hypothetical protein PPSIR1_35742 [Plesiocystis pacifica SIR-1]|uniref:Uncharacterized protein n=1 Tax=Plesiocystis pacifica SIR-1 TaxID=391625 RepID=A6G1S7_9BACT|nr:hypothetical protein PPSIR1_35742 [Plesiocystis pacifica SIR-1]